MAGNRINVVEHQLVRFFLVDGHPATPHNVAQVYGCLKVKADALNYHAKGRTGATAAIYLPIREVPLLVPEAAARRAGSSSRLAGPTRHPMGSQD